ncbi:19964_t:CDS:2, partial [Racocetra fulgida]
MIEVLFQVRKDKYKDNPPIAPELDLVKEDDQITHHLSLDDELDKYKEIKAQILGEDSGDEEDESGSESDESSDEEEERTYEKFFGLIGERLAKINLVWAKAFEQCFVQYYETIHRYETNRLRNVSKFFGHLLASDALSWQVFNIIKLTEDDTTSSSRIFVKILFEELSGTLGLQKLKERLKDSTMLEYFTGLFPKDNPRNTRFAINYFTSIGLGLLTDELREHLQ